jgi:hypothetical protein
MRPISHKGLVVIAVAALMATFSALPAEARSKKQKQYRVPTTTSLSLDGRNTGRARTCWNQTFVYDNRGIPIGPYCH